MADILTYSTTSGQECCPTHFTSSHARTHTISLSHTHSLSLCRSKWLPVSIQVKNGELVIKKSTPPSLTSAAPPPPSPPLHEFRLSHNHTMTEPISRAYDRKTKVHQVRHHNFCFSSHLFHCLSLYSLECVYGQFLATCISTGVTTSQQ